MTQLLARLIRFWYRSVMVPDRAQSIKKELEAAVEAICDRSADRAFAAMERYHRDAPAALEHAMQPRAGGGVTQGYPTFQISPVLATKRIGVTFSTCQPFLRSHSSNSACDGA